MLIFMYVYFCLLAPKQGKQGLGYKQDRHIRLWLPCSISFVSFLAKNKSITCFTGHENSFDILSLDEEGMLILWAVVEAASKWEGSQQDLGLAPMAKLKLLKTATVRVQDSLPRCVFFWTCLHYSLRSTYFINRQSSLYFTNFSMFCNTFLGFW